MPLIVHADWEGDLEPAYERRVQTWRAMEPGPAEAYYRDELFPLSCERIRRMRADIEPLELLFVPVGTQSYAPILARPSGLGPQTSGGRTRRS